MTKGPESRHEDVSMLIVSCDKYADLWKPFFSLFFRHLKSPPFRVCLGTNMHRFHDPRVISVAIGPDTNWSAGLMKMLTTVNTPYVILMLEDFFLRKPADADKILRCVDAMKNLDGVMIRLVPRRPPDVPMPEYPFLGRIFPDSAYRVSAQPTLWKTSALVSLLKDGESIWEFEINGSLRSRGETHGFYAVWKPVIPCGHHVIERGKWFRKEARRFGAMNIGCDFSRRPIMTVTETYFWLIGKITGELKNLLPWDFRQRIKHAIMSRFR